MIRVLRRLLGREVTVGSLLEIAFRIAVPYLVVGVIVVGVNVPQLQQLQTLHQSREQILSFGVLVAGWPAVLIADVCMY
jgi:hypothetical protein